MSWTAVLVTCEIVAAVVYFSLRAYYRRVLLRRAWYEQAEAIVGRMLKGTRFVVVTPPRGMSLAEAQEIVDRIYRDLRPEDRLPN